MDASPPVTAHLATIKPLASTNNQELPSEAINRSDLKTLEEVLQLHPALQSEEKMTLLAIKLAREVLGMRSRQCTPKGWKDCPALPQKELNDLKKSIFNTFPRFWSQPQHFEKAWVKIQEALAQACKRLRRKFLA